MGENCWQESCGSKGKVVVSMNIFVTELWKIVAISWLKICPVLSNW